MGQRWPSNEEPAVCQHRGLLTLVDQGLATLSPRSTPAKERATRTATPAPSGTPRNNSSRPSCDEVAARVLGQQHAVSWAHTHDVAIALHFESEWLAGGESTSRRGASVASQDALPAGHARSGTPRCPARLPPGAASSLTPSRQKLSSPEKEEFGPAARVSPFTRGFLCPLTGRTMAARPSATWTCLALLVIPGAASSTTPHGR